MLNQRSATVVLVIIEPNVFRGKELWYSAERNYYSYEMTRGYDFFIIINLFYIRSMIPRHDKLENIKSYPRIIPSKKFLI